MQFEEPIRILSDIHLGHPASMVPHAESLSPLLRDIPTVIFNGDTVEARFLKDRPKSQWHLSALEEVCAGLGVRPVLINGNHDPAVSPLSHVDLADGGVMVTHGDMLFHDISPWSDHAETMRAAHEEALEKLEDEAFHDFEKRLQANKCGSLALELHKSNLPRGRLARIMTFLREAWPPWRPLQIIKCWVETPGKAIALARVFRPRARVIVIGHTHYSGVWRIGPRVVINTGSFLPVAGRMLIDLEGTKLSLRKIVKRGSEFQPGSEIARFEATKLRAHEGF